MDQLNQFTTPEAVESINPIVSGQQTDGATDLSSHLEQNGDQLPGQSVCP